MKVSRTTAEVAWRVATAHIRPMPSLEICEVGTCGVWCVVCGVWCVACGVWRVGVRRVACGRAGVRRAACGVRAYGRAACGVRHARLQKMASTKKEPSPLPCSMCRLVSGHAQGVPPHLEDGQHREEDKELAHVSLEPREEVAAATVGAVARRLRGGCGAAVVGPWGPGPRAAGLAGTGAGCQAGPWVWAARGRRSRTLGGWPGQRARAERGRRGRGEG
jgi:hypothetical protein